MALRLSHWLAVVAVSLAVVAAWRLPLDSATGGRLSARSPAETRHVRLTRELAAARTALDQLRRAERLPAAAIESADAGVAILIPEGATLAPDQVTALGRRAAREATAFGPIEPGMIVAYGYDGARGEATGLAVAQPFRLETYTGELDGTAYCVHVVVTRPQMVSFLASEDLEGEGWSRWTQSLLGPCVFYATYGLPGARLREWLDAGGIGFALGHPFDGAPSFPRAQRRWLFGTGARGLGGPTAVERCMTAEAEACVRLFLDPLGAEARGFSPREDPPSPASFSGTARTGPFPTDNWFLMADLEAEFGPEAFRRFWTSDRDVVPAFESVFGVDLGDWLLEWLDGGPGLGRRSPAPSWPLTFTGLLTVALMTGMASAWQTRRQVS